MDMKFDNNKPRMDLIEPEFLEGIAKVLTLGASKYAPDSWKTQVSDPTNRYYAAALRHLTAWKKGEKTDSESGLSHLYHAACNLMFLGYFDATSPMRWIKMDPVETCIEFMEKLYSIDGTTVNCIDIPINVQKAYHEAMAGTDFIGIELAYYVKFKFIGTEVRESRENFYREMNSRWPDIKCNDGIFHVAGPRVNLPYDIEHAFNDVLNGDPIDEVEKQYKVTFLYLGRFLLKARDTIMYKRTMGDSDD